MNPGKMTARIEVYRHRDTWQEDELGADGLQEQLVYTCWANIAPRTGSILSGREAGTMLSKTTHKITIRHTDKVDQACWIMYRGHRFDIDFIQDDFRGKYLEIFVQEVV